MLTFSKCVELMTNARNGRKKLGNNTYLYELDANTFGVMLHSTYVVKVHRNGTYTLNSGGWQTVTTKDRINEYAPVRLFQKNHAWFLQVGGWDNGRKVEYTDGMTVDASGAPVETNTPAPAPAVVDSLFA